jgi:GDP-L-fucose synthase
MIVKTKKVYIAGHRGLVGSAILRTLEAEGFINILTRTHQELNLIDQKATRDFFQTEQPDYVLLAAGKVGGIMANNTYKAEFIYENMMIAANVIHSAFEAGVEKLINLGLPVFTPRWRISH